jgi:hypothetical protein
VSGWVSLEHARSRIDELGGGYVSYSVDPARVLANRASLRDGDPAAYWEAARPLAAWQADGSLPEDLEVHQNVPVRAKRLQIHAPIVTEEQLGDYAEVVAAIADADRLSAKALMHLAIIASHGDFDSTDFTAACALAWRDEPDPDRLIRELVEMDPDKVVSAVLAEHTGTAPELMARLREVLVETRTLGRRAGDGAWPGAVRAHRGGARRPPGPRGLTTAAVPDEPRITSGLTTTALGDAGALAVRG